MLNTEDVCTVLIEAIFDNPTEAFDVCNSNTFVDDNAYPISKHLLFTIKRAIVTGEYPLQNKPDGEQINIKSDKSE